MGEELAELVEQRNDATLRAEQFEDMIDAAHAAAAEGRPLNQAAVERWERKRDHYRDTANRKQAEIDALGA